MKSHTDLPQSKKLMEFLPPESADMRYHTISHYNPYPCDETVYTVEFGKASGIDIPCWSLAALLDILDFDITRFSVSLWSKEGEWVCIITEYGVGTIFQIISKSKIDACVEMIIKLHEQKLL